LQRLVARTGVIKTAQFTGGLCESSNEWNIIANNTVWVVIESRKNKRKKHEHGTDMSEL